MALSFTEGSIGGDIEKVNLNQLEAFYGKAPVERSAARIRTTTNRNRSGSNGMAVAPSNTAAHHALLLINPHTSFFFRVELQMSSDEGLERLRRGDLGPVLRLSGIQRARRLDAHLERRGCGRRISGNGDARRATASSTNTATKSARDRDADHRALQDRSRHGGEEIHGLPHASRAGGSRTERQVGQLPDHAGADQGAGAILLRAPRRRITNRIGRRWNCRRIRRTTRSLPTPTATSPTSTAISFRGAIPNSIGRKPVDGSNPETEWKGLLRRRDAAPAESASGWLYNSNNWPWSAAGPSSPKREDYPTYVENGGESARGLHAIRVLQRQEGFHARFADRGGVRQLSARGSKSRCRR